jgi:DNA-binding transcriptional LysR family regulator
MEADDHLIIRALLKQGVGYSLLTQGAFRSELPLGELQAWPLRPRAFWGLALMEMPHERRNEAVTALAALIRPTLRDLVRANKWPGALLPD